MNFTPQAGSILSWSRLYYRLVIITFRKMPPSSPYFTRHKCWFPRAIAKYHKLQFNSVQSLSHIWFFVPPWTAARQASLSITNSRSLRKLMSIKLVMQSSHLILCHPLLLPPTPPSIRVFSNESALCMRCPKNWSFSFNISLSNEHPGLISFRMDWLDLLVEISPNSDKLRQI